MLYNDQAAACPKGTNILPQWVTDEVASAPRISPADAAPLIAIFRSAMTAATVPAVAA